MSAAARKGGPRQEREERADAGPRSFSQGVWEQVSTLLVAVMIALAVRAFVIEPFRIPSGSMFPTLLIGDHLFVNKFIYGIKVPFSDTRLPGLREPERGDVIVFTVAKDHAQTYPADRRPDLPREEFVKRVVGIPGDRIELRDGAVVVNGEPMDTRPLGEFFDDGSGRRLAISEVLLEGNHRYRILDDLDRRVRDPAPVTVEPGRYFVLGDNRDNSKDSRFWGTVRLAEIKGPAFVLYWSWNYNGGWLELLNPATLWRLFSQEMRWTRIGDMVR